MNLHLSLALAVGFLFVVMGLTGSCNVFMDELDELFNPDLVVQAPGREPFALDDLLAAVRKAHPELT
ncbi:MAG: PepSY domain-containing protein, partial [Terriglobales bacterium]